MGMGLLFQHRLWQDGHGMVFGYHLHHEVPLAGQQRELGPEARGVAGVHDLPVQNEIVVENVIYVLKCINDVMSCKQL